MIKKALFTVVGLGLTTVVLFRRDAARYVGTTYHRLTSSVKESVPTEFQIDRAQAMVRDLEPEIRRSMHVIAKEEVALESLNKQIAVVLGTKEGTVKMHRGHVMRKLDLGSLAELVSFADRLHLDDPCPALHARAGRFRQDAATGREPVGSAV